MISVENINLDRIDRFNQWLNARLNERNWSDRQLARSAGISSSVISKIRAGILPGWEASAKIADALNLPAEVVFRCVGLLPAISEEELDKSELTVLFDKATPDQRRQILDFVHYILRK